MCVVRFVKFIKRQKQFHLGSGTHTHIMNCVCALAQTCHASIRPRRAARIPMVLIPMRACATLAPCARSRLTVSTAAHICASPHSTTHTHRPAALVNGAGVRTHTHTHRNICAMCARCGAHLNAIWVKPLIKTKCPHIRPTVTTTRACVLRTQAEALTLSRFASVSRGPRRERAHAFILYSSAEARSSRRRHAPCG